MGPFYNYCCGLGTGPRVETRFSAIVGTIVGTDPSFDWGSYTPSVPLKEGNPGKMNPM